MNWLLPPITAKLRSTPLMVACSSLRGARPPVVGTHKHMQFNTGVFSRSCRLLSSLCVSTCFYLPGVTDWGHGGDSQGCGSAIGRDQNPMCADGCRLTWAQCSFQRCHFVELDSGQTADEAWSVVALYEDGVDLSSLCKRAAVIDRARTTSLISSHFVTLTKDLPKEDAFDQVEVDVWSLR